MKVAVGMLTYNAYATGRSRMLYKAWSSTVPAHAGHDCLRQILTNGSTDETTSLVEGMGGIVDNTDSRIFHGMRRLFDWGVSMDARVIVFTADDIEYRYGWLQRLVNAWEAAPDDVAIISPLLEPMYPWNTITDAIDIGGERALVRDSVGGCAWSFRASDRDFLDPPAIMPGEDLEVCRRVRAAGRRMLQLDLADHIGEQHSAWGNQSWRNAIPVDRAEWGLPDGA